MGWSLDELAVLYGITNAALTLSQMIARGFHTFESIIRLGEFDRVLLRPRSIMLQLLARDLALHQLGRLAQGLGVLIWGIAAGHLPFGPMHFVLLMLAITGGICLYSGLAVLQATAAFWTIEGLEVFNVFVYGGSTFASYPLECYRRPLRIIFLYLIPVALVSYPPCLWLLGRAEEHGWPAWACWCAPAAGPIFLMLAARAWQVGLKRYASTGS